MDMKLTVLLDNNSCPQCGARISRAETCQELFYLIQLKEIEQWAYYKVHPLSVPCYLLQHNGYSREGWLAVRELLHQFVRQGLTPEQARQKYRPVFDNRRRSWSITKGAKLPGVEKIAWTYTIADVRLDTPETYCADVRRWAESILDDSERLIGGLKD
jgi:hypothetical protein